MSTLDDWGKDDPEIKRLVAKLRPFLIREIQGAVGRAMRDGQKAGLAHALSLAKGTHNVALLIGRIERALEDV